ncbi:hypothetical protein [Shewanella sp. AC91-MNA-CIBAN-0169]|uniref:hypothetical protein n=1 Tax=Shewanella sp. AC91-MNA-CIBAN-0169 TaxID=3140466 RepID=UPI003316A60D
MSDKTVAIKIGERYFCGFGKDGSIKTAWSIAGAKLFLSRQIPEVIVNQLKKKNKKFEIVNVIEEPSADLVWMTREEFNHYTAIQKMKPVNIDFIREFALNEMQRSKAVMNSNVDFGDFVDSHFFKVDAIEWARLARGLQREINKLGGL